MDRLCTFVRNPTEDAILTGNKVREDVQAAMRAISSCHVSEVVLRMKAKTTLDLNGADLRGAQLSGVFFF